VALDHDQVIGSAALELYGPAALLRSVAVDREHRGQGLGQRLTRAALELGSARGVSNVYLLTETARGFFGRLGFQRIPREQAEPAVGESAEFKGACPATATCMALSLQGTHTPGYTLIETVVAIVVFGILLSIAWVRMGPALASARVRNAATVIATDLQYAQMLAVRQRRPVAVIVDPGMRSYIIRLRDSSLTFRDRFFGPDTEYLLDSLSASPTSVVLFPSGVTAGTVTFTARQGVYTRHVRLTRAGQVRIVP
jgi:amino-acid N-acetyltransferase